MYRLLIRPLFFLFSSERAHALAMRTLLLLLMIPGMKYILRRMFSGPDSPVTLMGLRFPNRLGIAAGFDKNGSYINALATLGFGHIEIGSVTPKPQAGNPKPRLFRLLRSEGLINRMGFNNDGCVQIAERLQEYQNRKFILGANIGKNKDTPNEEAIRDYITCFDALHPCVDYFVINVSSPNTPGLRALQEREPLKQLLLTILARNNALQHRKPVLLKIAPDLTDDQLDDIAALVQEVPIDGLVVSNTTISREGLKEDLKDIEKIGAGGLSGKPLQMRAEYVLKYLTPKIPQHLVMIGVGGIDSGSTAKSRMEAGAHLIQIYTGFIFQGPGLIRKILRTLHA